MLRLINIFGSRVARSQNFVRCVTTEPMSNFTDLDREKKIKIFELEIDMIRQEGRKAPDLQKIRPQDWERILEFPTKSARRRFYQYLWQIEMKQDSVKIKKELKKVENEKRLQREREENEQNDHIIYGLNRNSMFLRIYDSTINHFHNQKLFRAMMFEQKLIIDCSYDEFMNPREATNTGKQLMLCFAENRMHDEPFDLQYCNVNMNSITAKTLKNFVPTMLDPDFPMNIHRQSMTELYDKQKLVYLTPHCNNDLKEFNHDDIYIIGAMVDKTNNDPLSLAKAKKLGIRMARLPLDNYLTWGSGSGKSLTINQMVSIMLEMKKHGDWKQALRFVPRRKVLDDEALLARTSEVGRKSPFDSMKFNQNRPRKSFTGKVTSRSDFDNRQNYREDTRNQNFREDFEDRKNFRENSRNQNFREDSRNQSFKSSNFDKSRQQRERKHFDKFNFDLDTWGQKVNPKHKKDR